MSVGRQLEAAVECAREVGLDLDRALVEAAVLESERELGGTAARRHDPVDAAEQRLEVDVPDPRDVAAVCDRVVQRDDGNARRTTLDERAHGFVRARGILDQQQEQLLAVDRDALEPAESGAEATETVDDLVEGGAESARKRRGTDGVVDVVETRQRQLDAPRSLGRHEIECGPLEAGELDRAGGDLELRPRVTAIRTAIV